MGGALKLEQESCSDLHVVSLSHSLNSLRQTVRYALSLTNAAGEGQKPFHPDKGAPRWVSVC